MDQMEYHTTLPNTPTGMSRRDALRSIGLSPLAAAALIHTTSTPLQARSSDAKAKVVIVGGGTGAIIVLSKLFSILTAPDITIIAPNETQLYQQGQLFLAVGEYTLEDIIKGNDNYIPQHVSWVQDSVKQFDPENSRVITQKRRRITYDYLVVATGIEPYYEDIQGLDRDAIGQDGVASVYQNDLAKATATGAQMTPRWLDEISLAAKERTPTVIFTQPSTPIKCESAPQQLLFLGADYLKQKEPTRQYDFRFASAQKKLSRYLAVADALEKVHKQYPKSTTLLDHELIAIDTKSKQATFRVGESKDEVRISYDFIHIVPPMGPPKAVRKSPLVWEEGPHTGWLEVDPQTLQHLRYPNVFGIGDVCGMDSEKTATSARYQAIALVENLIASMEGNSITAKYDGRTFCSIKTALGKSIAADHDREGLVTTFPFLDPLKPGWLWWAKERYLYLPVYWQLVLRGLV